MPDPLTTLCAEDAEVLRAVMESGPATLDEIAWLLGRPRASLAGALERLVTAGFVRREAAERDDAASVKWVAEPPEHALEPALARGRDEQLRAEAMFAELAAAYRRGSTGRSESELVEVVVDPVEQARRLVRIEAGARETIDAFQSGDNRVIPTVAVMGEDEVTPPRAEYTERNPRARYRVVVDRAYLSEPRAAEVLRQRLDEGVRVVEERLVKLVIADGELAMVKLNGTPGSLVLRPPLVALAQELFDVTWRAARPFARAESALDPDDQQLLQLMIAGLTDQAMAHQLQCSARTVQRRLRQLMTRADASSRLALGWHALRNGWV